MGPIEVRWVARFGLWGSTQLWELPYYHNNSYCRTTIITREIEAGKLLELNHSWFLEVTQYTCGAGIHSCTDVWM